MYIPYINYINPFIWLYNSHFCDTKKPSRPRVLWIFFSTCLSLVIPAQLMYRIYPTVGMVMTYINAYVIPLIWGYRFANLQEELDSK